MPTYNTIHTLFNSYNSVKQVIIFAEALRREQYELLTELSKCIPPQKREEFFTAIDLWLQ